MPQISRLNVKLLLDSTGFATGGAKAIGVAQKVETRFQSLTKSASAMALGFAGGFGIFTAVNFLKQSVQASEEARLASAKLASTLKSTGNTTGFLQSQIEKYATALQTLTAIEDDSIVAGTAVLARFKNVSGSVFKDATRLAVDLAAETGNLDGAFLTLGKALSDPTKGMTALTRAGVKFSVEQKTQIKDLITANDLFGAQAIILKGVESAYGGLAKTQKTTWSDFWTEWSKFQEEVGKAGTSNDAKGIADALAKNVSNSNKALQDFSKVMDNEKSTWRQMLDAFLEVDKMFSPAMFKQRAGTLKEAAESFTKTIRVNTAVQMRGLFPEDWRSIFDTKWDFDTRPGNGTQREPSRDPGGNQALVQGSNASNNALNAFRRANTDKQVKILESVKKNGDITVSVLKEIRNQGIGGKTLKVADF